MYRLTLPFTDTSLVLTPPFESLPGWLQVVLAALGLSLTGGLLVWLYSYEARLVRPSRALGLLALRGVVLALLWLVALQPVISRPASETVAGRVLIAIDRSDSMSISDPQRDNSVKLNLARGLGLASDICQDDELDGWIKQYAERGSVRFAQSAVGETERARHNQVISRIDAFTRLQLAQQVLSGDRVKLISELGKRHKLEIVGFSQQSGQLTPEEVAALVPAKAGESNSAFTNLRLPLVRALEHSGPDTGKVLGIVLLTDGQHNWGPPPSTKAGELGKLGVPIFPIVLGAKNPPSDVAVTTVQAPTAVFKNSELPVEARIQVNGMSAANSS